MKLRSVRLAEVGPFFDGVAVDGIPAGLGVLIGPNELGKSTVLRALHLLFSEPHTAQNKTVKACRSYQGGAPLVEAEFELGGRVFRLRKRYLAGKFADLVSLGDGRMWRNQEAEEEIARLLANHQAVAGGRGLLWVEQTKSFSIPSGKEHEELGNALAGFIKCEAAAVAGGDGLARVRRLAAQSLSELVTAGRQQPKKGGPLALAMQERERLAGELKAAEAARVQADTRTRTLAELRERERDLGCPERARQGDAERVAAEHALEAAKLARARLETTTYKVQGLEAEFQAKAGELNRARALLTELNRLDVELAEFRQKRILRGDALAEADAEVADLQREARDFECRAEVVQGRLRDSEARLRAEQLARSLVECTRRLDAVRSAMQRARALDGELASKAGIPGDVSALRSLEHERQVLLALQTTAAARLEVRYLP
ncbi:MAG: hypothetical protein RLZ98_3488, partial [Pseudomonadota bacterium]